LLAINVLLYLGGTRVLSDDNSNMLNNFIDFNVLEDSDQVVINEEFTEALPATFQESEGGFLAFVDALRQLGKFAAFVVNIVFTPLGLLTGAGLPADIVLVIGVPLMSILFFGMAYFIRSGG